jgi:ring-1,2-phenylacetyl-CoA epoxidase subunit PaaD
MVTTVSAMEILAGVPDPEIPVVSVVDLGIVRDVVESADGRRVTVTLTPTYSGCPATEVIAHDVRVALKEKLHGFGIAPPSSVTVDGRISLPLLEIGAPAACPHCGSRDVEELAGFGSTPCKALWRCVSCREPFDYFKRH